jgi:hypothetical protein
MTDFELEDVEGRRRRLSEFRGRPVVLAVAGQKTGEAAGEFGAALAPRLGDSGAQVVTVADVTGVPRLARGFARGAIRSGAKRVQQQAARDMPNLPPDAWQRFTLLLDWDGTALDALGLRGKTDRFHVRVLDAQGQERGRLVQGEAAQAEQIDAVLRWLDAAG